MTITSLLRHWTQNGGTTIMVGKYNRNNNFTFAISFIVTLLASSTLTGSSLAKVSFTPPFEQEQQKALKIWSDSLPADSQKQGLSITNFETSIHAKDTGINPAKSSSSHNCTCPNLSNSTKTANMTKANATSIIIVRNISNIKGPVKVNFVNSYWTFNTAQDQFVAGTTSARTPGQSILPVIKQEVGPGEGQSLLAVVLINEGFSAITGITSSLELPQGFEPLITPQRSSIPGSDSQTALSSYDGVVEPGGAFTLYFGVKVLGNAQVGKQYNPELKLGYVKVTELRQKHFRSETITVPFTISGRVILDAVSSSPSLSSLSNISSLTNSSSFIQTINVVPGVPNAVKLTIRNDGSATARGVIVNIAGLTAASVGSTTVTVATNVSSGVAAQPSSSSTVILGSKVFSIGTISPGGSQEITLIIYPSIAAAGTVQTLNLGLSYDDAYGNRKTTNQLVGLQILPLSPQSGLSVSPSPSSSSSPSSTSPSPSSSPSSPSSSTSFSASPATSSGNDMIPKVASFVHSSSNGNNGNTNNNAKANVDLPSPVSTNPSSPSSLTSSSHNSSPSSMQITAGKIQNVTFAINNDNAAASPIVNPLQNSITDLAVSLVSQSNSVRILGPSNWNLPTISPGSGQQLTTQVFASTSLMGNPVVFTVIIHYIQDGHQVKTASFNLGAMVVGDIQLRVNNIGIRYIGNTPTLVGNILNEGNTPARFGSVEILNQGQRQVQTQLYALSSSNKSLATILTPNSSQYLGNIATNSPVPFNIPLQTEQVPIAKGQQQNNITTNKNMKEKIPSLTRIALNSSAIQSYRMGTDDNTAHRMYPVSLKITYSDDLKIRHEIVVNSPVQIKPQQPSGSANQGRGIFAFLGIGGSESRGKNGGGSTGLFGIPFPLLIAIIVAIVITAILIRRRRRSNILSVSPGQINFRGGPSSPPTIIFNSEVVNRIKSLPYVQEVIPTYQGQLQLDAQGNIIRTQVLAMDPSKVYLISRSLQLVDGSSIQPNNPSGIIVGDSTANPPGNTTAFVTVDQTVKATYSSADPKTRKLQQESRSFVVTGVMQPTGNNQIDKAVVINEATANSLFHKGGKYDGMAVAAVSADYVNAVQQKVTNIYGSNNIGVITPKAILQARQQFQSGNCSFTLDLAFIALLVGAVGNVTTPYTSVNERIREIGTMKAFGAKNRFILSLHE